MHEGQIKALSKQITELPAKQCMFVSCSTWNEGNSEVTNNKHFELSLKMIIDGKVINIIIGIYGQVYYMP